MAPRLVLVTADEVGDDWLVGDELELADGDGLDAATELCEVVVVKDWATDDGAVAVPPTLAQEVRATAATATATATRPDLMKIGRAVARPCDISPFCQHGRSRSQRLWPRPPH
jgi:hypothetical protein